MSFERALPSNPDQLRKLETSLRLLCEDLEALLCSADLGRGTAETPGLKESIQQTLDAAKGLLRKFGFPTDRLVPFPREVVATAEIWIARLEDLKARRLASYGALPVEVIGRSLDPQLEQLQRALAALAQAAGGTLVGESDEGKGR